MAVLLNRVQIRDEKYANFDFTHYIHLNSTSLIANVGRKVTANGTEFENASPHLRSISESRDHMYFYIAFISCPVLCHSCMYNCPLPSITA